jgi:hypothetical protein
LVKIKKEEKMKIKLNRIDGNGFMPEAKGYSLSLSLSLSLQKQRFR